MDAREIRNTKGDAERIWDELNSTQYGWGDALLDKEEFRDFIVDVLGYDRRQPVGLHLPPKRKTALVLCLANDKRSRLLVVLSFAAVNVAFSARVFQGNRLIMTGRPGDTPEDSRRHSGSRTACCLPMSWGVSGSRAEVVPGRHHGLVANDDFARSARLLGRDHELVKLTSWAAGSVSDQAPRSAPSWKVETRVRNRWCDDRLSIPNDSLANRRDRWRCQAKSGSTLRPMGRNPVCYNYRATLIPKSSCLKPVDTHRPLSGLQAGDWARFWNKDNYSIANILGDRGMWGSENVIVTSTGPYNRQTTTYYGWSDYPETLNYAGWLRKLCDEYNRGLTSGTITVDQVIGYNMATAGFINIPYVAQMVFTLRSTQQP